MNSRTSLLLVAVALFASSCAQNQTPTTKPVRESTPSHQHAMMQADSAPVRAVSSSQGGIGFVCAYSHRNNDDPIVSPNAPGSSHVHEYFGAEGVDAHTTWQDLHAMPNTCESASDYSSYWVPQLLADGSPVQPQNMAVYLRTPKSANPRSVTMPPNGLQLISVRAGWTCARTQEPRATWHRCPRTATTRLILEYPDCWNGSNLYSSDHFSHVASSVNGHCPSSHPVMIPQFVTEVRYDLHALKESAVPELSAGSLDLVHGDMIVSWNQSKLKRDISTCIYRSVSCELTWSTQLNG